jgi:hypothetical protein
MNDMSEEETNDQVDQIYDLGNKISRQTVAVVDTLVQRGAFKGEELSTIGALRDTCIQLAQMCEAYHSQKDGE